MSIHPQPEIPKAKGNLHLDPADFAKKRWAWGVKHIPVEFKVESGARDPLHEAYEELVDSINYLNAEMVEQVPGYGQLMYLRNDLIALAERVRMVLCGRDE